MKGLEYRYPRHPQTFITEPYVSSPPALWIVDETGAIWTLGIRVEIGPRGEYAFPVLRNGRDTGEIASRIERRGGRIRIFTAKGYKHYNGFTFI